MRTKTLMRGLLLGFVSSLLLSEASSIPPELPPIVSRLQSSLYHPAEILNQATATEISELVSLIRSNHPQIPYRAILTSLELPIILPLSFPSPPPVRPQSPPPELLLALFSHFQRIQWSSMGTGALSGSPLVLLDFAPLIAAVRAEITASTALQDWKFVDSILDTVPAPTSQQHVPGFIQELEDRILQLAVSYENSAIYQKALHKGARADSLVLLTPSQAAFVAAELGECAVCLQPQTARAESVSICKNAHYFHFDCLRNSIDHDRPKRCPCCRDSGLLLGQDLGLLVQQALRAGPDATDAENRLKLLIDVSEEASGVPMTVARSFATCEPGNARKVAILRRAMGRMQAAHVTAVMMENAGVLINRFREIDAIERISEFIDAGADVNANNGKLLISALVAGKTELADRLFDKGARLNGSQWSRLADFKAMMTFVVRTQPDLIVALTEGEMEVFKNAVLITGMAGDVEMLNWLSDKVNFQTIFGETRHAGFLVYPESTKNFLHSKGVSLDSQERESSGKRRRSASQSIRLAIRLISGRFISVMVDCNMTVRELINSLPVLRSSTRFITGTHRHMQPQETLEAAGVCGPAFILEFHDSMALTSQRPFLQGLPPSGRFVNTVVAD